MVVVASNRETKVEKEGHGRPLKKAPILVSCFELEVQANACATEQIIVCFTRNTVHFCFNKHNQLLLFI
jgi:hypothetical protein